MDGGRRGRRASRRELPDAGDCALELEVRRGAQVRAGCTPSRTRAAAPRSPRALRRLRCRPRDRVEGERVAVGFGAPTPRYLALRGADGAFGPNLLDRLKVRAHARFLGFIPLGRDEDDIEYEFGAWRAGPMRVVRREYQWVRLASWLRTPIFETETLMTRDAMTLPVRLQLNFPPTYFFGGIEVQAVLDFRDLRGWQVAAAAVEPAARRRRRRRPARRRPQRLGRAPRPRRDAGARAGARRLPGDPGADHRLSRRWRAEPAGGGGGRAARARLSADGVVEASTAVSTGSPRVARALPPDADLAAFARERAEPIAVIARPLAADGSATPRP